MKVLFWWDDLLTNSGVKPRRDRICEQRSSISLREGFLAEGTVKAFVNRIERRSDPLYWNVLFLKWDVQNSVWMCGWENFMWWLVLVISFLFANLTNVLAILYSLAVTRSFFVLKTIYLYDRLTQGYDVLSILSSWQSFCQSTSLNSIAVTNEVRVI